MEKKDTYAVAMKRLEDIVEEISNQNTDIDLLTDRIKEANKLIASCRKKLNRVDKEVEKLLNPDNEREG